MGSQSDRAEAAAVRNILSRLRMGVWSFEIEKDCPPRMYGDAMLMDLLDVEGETLTPEDLYTFWYDRVDPQHYDALADGIDQIVRGNRAEIQYPWLHPTKGVVFFRCSATRNENGFGSICLEGLLQDVTDLQHIQEADARHGSMFGRRVKAAPKAFESQDKDFSVVIVDDMALNLRILETRFEHLGVERTRVRSFENAQDALADIARARPSLILTDMWMPGMNGEELARAVRKDESFKDIPIVAETADVDVSDAFDMSVFNAVLHKPLTDEKLREMFKKVFPN